MKKVYCVAVTLMIMIASIMLSGCNKEETYNFSDEIILVTLTYEATFNGKTYSLDNFPELQLSKVTEIFNNPTEPHHRKILELKLLHPNHKTVLEYIEILNERSDVQSAGYSGPGAIA